MATHCFCNLLNKTDQVPAASLHALFGGQHPLAVQTKHPGSLAICSPSKLLNTGEGDDSYDKDLWGHWLLFKRHKVDEQETSVSM